MQATEQHLTRAQVQEKLNCCRPTVQRMLTRGDFPNAFRLGSRDWRIPLSDLQAYIERQRAHANN